MHTEEQAKEMWCPASRVCATMTDGPEDPAHVGYNRVYIAEEGQANFADPRSTNPQIARCIASQCMWWRWELTEGMPPQPRTGLGYCGIAGGPQI